MRDNRVRWATVVQTRSQTLADLVSGVGGAMAAEYDATRDAFRALPYGEDRLAADAADRGCWLDNSPVADAVERARAAIVQLRALFKG